MSDDYPEIATAKGSSLEKLHKDVVRLARAGFDRTSGKVYEVKMPYAIKDNDEKDIVYEMILVKRCGIHV